MTEFRMYWVKCPCSQAVAKFSGCRPATPLPAPVPAEPKALTRIEMTGHRARTEKRQRIR